MTARARRLLITGGHGFVARTARPHFRDRGYEVVSLVRKGADEGEVVADLEDRAATLEAVRRTEPSFVLHLAGKTYLPDVEADPSASFGANVLGSLNLFEALAEAAPRARLIVASSCTVYGEPREEDLPLKETAPLRAVHPYGVQKIGVELLAKRFAKDRGLDAVIARPFNHIGPGQDVRISLTHFARQIAAAERRGKPAVLRVGNLAAERDFLDVRDVVLAYERLFELPDPPRIVNIASGCPVAIRKALELLLEDAKVAFTVENDPARLRRLDVARLFGDATLLRTTTGWAPRFELATTLRRILEFARGLREQGV